jgi:DegV family protein with EDD domain
MPGAHCILQEAAMRVRVVTDSSTNVPDPYLARLKIVELPALVNFGAESFLNKVEISAEEFYRRLAAADKLPTTAQPSPQQFAAAYAQLAAEGAQEVIAVAVSGKMSGTLNSATVAAEHAPIKVHLWDSLNASVGAGWQAIAAAEMARDGLPSAEILAQLAGIRARMQTATTPATLRNLIASGRAPRLKGSIGELLDIKPILAMVDGMLEPVGQARGRRKAVAEVVNRTAEALGDRPARVAVAHANALEEAERLAETVRGRLNVTELVITELGPVLATLAGPGIIAVCAYTV